MKGAVMAEFPSPETLAAALRELRARGYQRLDAYTPYPIDDVIDALALPASPIPWFVFGGAAFGGGLAYAVQWFTTAIAYRLNVGGRPFHPGPAFVPITYELATLFGALVGFVAFFFLVRLPRPWHPVFEVEGFESVSADKFWLRAFGLRVDEDGSELAEAFAALQDLGASRIVVEEAA